MTRVLKICISACLTYSSVLQSIQSQFQLPRRHSSHKAFNGGADDFRFGQPPLLRDSPDLVSLRIWKVHLQRFARSSFLLGSLRHTVFKSTEVLVMTCNDTTDYA